MRAGTGKMGAKDSYVGVAACERAADMAADWILGLERMEPKTTGGHPRA